MQYYTAEVPEEKPVHGLYLNKACISALVSLLYTICSWLGAMAMQGEDAKLAL